MVTLGGAKGFFCNILYAGVLLFFTVTLYGAVNALLGAMGGYLGVEPIAFGIFVTLIDSVLLLLKGMFLKMIADARRQ